MTRLLHEFFEVTARRRPDQVAVEIPPGAARPDRVSVRYGELQRRSAELARRLPHVAGPDALVAVLLPRTNPDLFAAQLAILQAGAAHVCLEVTFPDERIRQLLTDARPAAVVTDAAGRRRLHQAEIDAAAIIEVDRPDRTEAPPEGRPAVTPEDLAYLIYTSGSTGQPKGVMIEHRSIANLVAGDLAEFQLGGEDRVAQGSSAAYDSSVEETWLAFAAGATLVVLDDATVRLGPDLIAWLRRERITVFCPPPTLLRATGCTDPENALPELRLLYVGGEPLPRDLADRWARGRTLVNGYGPTECSVTCLRDRIVPGGPIPIGRPIAGVAAWVLHEGGEEAAAGEQGELCVGGIGLARGYHGRPELTAEKFAAHPRLGRIYRTGDVVHRDAAGRFFYHGRLDAQVKLRGHRIELGEIETRLAALPGVRAAACYVAGHDGRAALAAALVPQEGHAPPSTTALRRALATTLPDHMVPSEIRWCRELPTTVGGKLDRAALARANGAETAKPNGHHVTIAPHASPERKILAAMSATLGLSRAVSGDEDFFHDLGGDSLAAAQVVSALRADPATAWATVRDLYEARTAAKLAARAPRDAGPPAPAAAGPTTDAPAVSSARRRRTAAGQAAWLAANLALASAAAYAVGFHLLPGAVAAWGIAATLLAAPLVLGAGGALYAVASVHYAALVKRLLIGRYTAQRAAVGGDFYLRNWIVQRTVRLVPWGLIDGTEFQCAALRALGARIGERVHLHRGVDVLRGGWDLLTLGNDVTVERDAVLELVRYEAGQLVIAPITLGAGCTVETHACVGGGARIEADGFLAARSSLARGALLPAGERWDGVPARPAGPAPEPPPIPAGTPRSPRTSAVQLVLARLILATARLVPAALGALALAWLWRIDATLLAAWLRAPTLDAGVVGGCVALAVLPLPLVLATEALACRTLGRLRPGVVSRWSGDFHRACLKAELVDSASRWLYGTLFWPAWLRAAGMKVGRGCEISSLLETVPELVEIGERTFCADGIYLGGPRLHRGTVTLAATRLGRRNFVGNGAVIPAGTWLPDDILIGVCTVADGARMAAGTSWFGHPAFDLARRPATGIDPRLTHAPPAARYAVRVAWEALRCALPAAFAFAGLAWCAGVARAAAAWPAAAFWLVALPLLSLAAILALAGVVVASKWILLGRVRPGTHPLWSAWASKWDFCCLAWNIHALPAVRLLDGTPALAWLLRAMGVRVGRRVVFGRGFAEDLPDPDLLAVEDDATVDCLLQSHTFEDRVLKMDHVTVRRHATVSRNAVLLYGAEIGAATVVAPNSVVMKHERLLPGRTYEGVPTHVAAGDAVA